MLVDVLVDVRVDLLQGGGGGLCAGGGTVSLVRAGGGVRAGDGRSTLSAPDMRKRHSTGAARSVARRAWRGPGWLDPGPRRPVKQLAVDIDRLRTTSAAPARTFRRRPNTRTTAIPPLQINALRFAADRQLGRAATIDEQTAAGVQRDVLRSIGRATLVHDRLRSLLPGKGRPRRTSRRSCDAHQGATRISAGYWEAAPLGVQGRLRAGVSSAVPNDASRSTSCSVRASQWDAASRVIRATSARTSGSTTTCSSIFRAR